MPQCKSGGLRDIEMNELYSVLLADDEEDVIQAIIRKIDWESLGFAVKGYAHNGLEALEIAEEHPPDVVMTDIKMPYMDGLALARKLKELYPAVKVIIFSGFDEFEYAKEAIRLEAEEYILKPIDAGELKSVFERIRTALDRERDEKQNVDMLKTYYLQSLPLLQENFYTALVEGRIPENEISRNLLYYQIELNSPFYTIVLLHISAHDIPEGINPLLLSMSVRKLAEERLGNSGERKFFNYLGNTVVIVPLARESELTRLTDACDTFCRLAKHICMATVSAGIGDAVSDIADIQTSYQGAKEANSYRVLYGRGKAISISEVAPQEHEETGKPQGEDFLYEVYKSIKMDDENTLRGAVRSFVNRTKPAKPSIQEYHFYTMEIVSGLYRFAANNQLDKDALFESDDIYRDVQQMNIEELEAWTADIAVKMREMLIDKRSDSTRSFVRHAMDYVHDHYADQDLTIEHVCSCLGLSSAYFSTVFKRETGKTFINYLTDFRMEKAVRMLLEEDQKTYVIAQAVGYQDPNYFSYAFKKKYGMSPSRYRSSQENHPE